MHHLFESVCIVFFSNTKGPSGNPASRVFSSCPKGLLCRRASNLSMFVCLCMCLSVCHKMCMFRNGFWSFTLCICTVFHQNAQKTKDANPIVQMMHHHLHDLSRHCSKHVNMHYFCMYTTGEIQKLVSENVECRLCR